MADEILLVSVPSATKIRTTNVGVTLVYQLIDAGGSVVGKKALHFNADDPGLTSGQRTTIVNFAKQALQVAGLIA